MFFLKLAGINLPEFDERPPMPSRCFSSRNQLIYEDCSPSDLLFGERLESIVGYVMSEVGIQDCSPDQSPIQTYFNYCDQLGLNFEVCEPYRREVERSGSCPSRTEVYSDLKSLLPKQHPQFDLLIWKAADQASEQFAELKSVLDLLVKFDKSSADLAEFVVFKLCRNGEAIEITPCLLNVSTYRLEVRQFLIPVVSEAKVRFRYEERKFIVGKAKIEEIIDRLKNRDYGF